MKAGDTVTLVDILPNVKDDGELQTKTVFEKCLGKQFVVGAIEQVAGLS